jgi:hypothetical protein
MAVLLSAPVVVMIPEVGMSTAAESPTKMHKIADALASANVRVLEKIVAKIVLKTLGDSRFPDGEKEITAAELVTLLQGCSLTGRFESGAVWECDNSQVIAEIQQTDEGYEVHAGLISKSVPSIPLASPS